jgi:hypothetical protein
MEEEWRDIVGYEGLYQVSNLGRVKSLFRYKKLLKPRIMQQYYSVCLWKDKKPKHMRVHRLVGMAFIPNPNDYPCINHKDENKLNNCVDNLEWCTHKYNANYGTRIERSVKHRPMENIRKPVLQILNGKVINRFESEVAAGEYIGSRKAYANIGSVCLGRKHFHTAYGYVWKFAEEKE